MYNCVHPVGFTHSCTILFLLQITVLGQLNQLESMLRRCIFKASELYFNELFFNNLIDLKKASQIIYPFSVIQLYSNSNRI